MSGTRTLQHRLLPRTHSGDLSSLVAGRPGAEAQAGVAPRRGDETRAGARAAERRDTAGSAAAGRRVPAPPGGSRARACGGGDAAPHLRPGPARPGRVRAAPAPAAAACVRCQATARGGAGRGEPAAAAMARAACGRLRRCRVRARSTEIWELSLAGPRMEPDAAPSRSLKLPTRAVAVNTSRGEAKAAERVAAAWGKGQKGDGGVHGGRGCVGQGRPLAAGLLLSCRGLRAAGGPALLQQPFFSARAACPLRATRVWTLRRIKALGGCCRADEMNPRALPPGAAKVEQAM